VNARLDSPFAGSVTGVEAIVKATQAFYTSFPDAAINEDPPIIDDNRVALFAIIAGSEVGEMMGLAAHKQAYQFPVSFLLELDGNCIQYERRVYDFTGLLVQIRVLKAKPV
jgi:predicted ester cyclase